MNALVFIIAKSIKNSIKELLKKPAKLVMYLLIAVSMAGLAVMTIFTTPSVEKQVPLFWFSGIMFLVFTLFYVISVLKGLSNGDSIFDMSDVNLLFVSPVSSQKILLYGIVKLTKISFLSSFFILFQSSSLANFGIKFNGLITILLCFMLGIIIFTTMSFIIYSITNGKPKRKLIVKIGAFLVFFPLIIQIATKYFASGDIIATLETAVKSPFMQYIPLVGWLSSQTTGILSGNATTTLIFLGLNILSILGLFAYILLANHDYYEDTLVATETAFEKKRKMAEGNIEIASQSTKKVKIKKTDIWGKGAAAIFGKHMLENFRTNRLGLITIPSLLVIVGSILLIAAIKEPVMALQILMWVQIFLIGTGRGLKETYSHYIYLIPESSFSKIIWSNMEIVIRTLIESVLIFVIGGIIAGANVCVIITSILAYTLFSFLLLGVNYLSMRFTGANISIGLLITFYYLSIVLVMAPGAIAALVVGFAIKGATGATIGLLILSAWELIAGAGCFALSQSVLHNCDMPTVKPKG